MALALDGTPKEQYEFKVVLLGDKGVGKTCLVLRFIEGHFNVRQQSTIGAFFLTKRIATQEGHSAKIQIWDTAGQEDYDRLRPLSYPQVRRAQGERSGARGPAGWCGSAEGARARRA